MDNRLQHVKAVRVVNHRGRTLPRYFEYVYYALVANAMAGEAWGTDIPFVGAGAMALLATLCVLRLGSWAKAVHTPHVFPLACAISFIAVQLILHGETIFSPDLRAFVTWFFALVIVPSLALRPGFLHRFAFAYIIIGLSQLPYMSNAYSTDELARFGTSGGAGLGNPNSLGMWFGFCCVYLIIFSIETKRFIARIASFLLAVGCLYIVGLSLSRGPLLGIALATVVALRRILKRAFLPALVLVLMGWAIAEAGIFDQIIMSYEKRIVNDNSGTGRSFLWQGAIERFRNSPLIGMGVSNSRIPVHPNTSKRANPHNGLLYIALASGVVPLAFFIAYWSRALRGALRAHAERCPEIPFLPPLLIFALTEMMILGADGFMSAWTVGILAVATAAGSPRRRHHVIVYQISKRKTDTHSKHLSKVVGGAMARNQLASQPTRS